MGTLDEMYDEFISGENKIDELHHRIAVQMEIPDSVLWTLYCIFEKESVHTQNSIAARMGVPKQTINSAVSWLTARGYAYMEQLQVYGNNKQILLTDEGKKLCEKFIAPFMAAEERAFNGLSKAEQETYLYLGIKHNRCQMEAFQALLTELGGVEK